MYPRCGRAGMHRRARVYLHATITQRESVTRIYRGERDRPAVLRLSQRCRYPLFPFLPLPLPLFLPPRALDEMGADRAKLPPTIVGGARTQVEIV